MFLLITSVSDFLRIYIIYIMEFYNSSHELEMIHKYNNTQGNKMILIIQFMNKAFYDKLSYYWLLDYYTNKFI